MCTLLWSVCCSTCVHCCRVYFETAFWTGLHGELCKFMQWMIVLMSPTDLGGCVPWLQCVNWRQFPSHLVQWAVHFHSWPDDCDLILEGGWCWKCHSCSLISFFFLLFNCWCPFPEQLGMCGGSEHWIECALDLKSPAEWFVVVCRYTFVCAWFVCAWFVCAWLCTHAGRKMVIVVLKIKIKLNFKFFLSARFEDTTWNWMYFSRDLPVFLNLIFQWRSVSVFELDISVEICQCFWTWCLLAVLPVFLDANLVNNMQLWCKVHKRLLLVRLGKPVGFSSPTFLCAELRGHLLYSIEVWKKNKKFLSVSDLSSDGTCVLYYYYFCSVFPAVLVWG